MRLERATQPDMPLSPPETATLYPDSAAGIRPRNGFSLKRLCAWEIGLSVAAEDRPTLLQGGD
jgi:hypothetical protein